MKYPVKITVIVHFYCAVFLLPFALRPADSGIAPDYVLPFAAPYFLLLCFGTQHRHPSFFCRRLSCSFGKFIHISNIMVTQVYQCLRNLFDVMNLGPAFIPRTLSLCNDFLDINNHIEFLLWLSLGVGLKLSSPLKIFQSPILYNLHLRNQHE